RGESISSREEWGFILAVLGRRPKANDFSLHIAKEPPGGQKTGTKQRRVGGGCASAPVSLGRIYEAGCLLLFKGTVLVLAGGDRGSGGVMVCASTGCCSTTPRGRRCSTHWSAPAG